MKHDTSIIPFRQPSSVEDPLTEIAREGARRMLAAVLKAEAASFVAQFAEERLPDCRQRVIRHGHGPERKIQTGIGPLEGPAPEGPGPCCGRVGVEEQLDEQHLDRRAVVGDPAVTVDPDAAVLEPVERALASERRAPDGRHRDRAGS